MNYTMIQYTLHKMCVVSSVMILLIMLFPVLIYAEDTPLSQSGTMHLTDDIMIEDKQIITVTTRDNHCFYIIIDRGNESDKSVYFLNPVDTIDLYAILNEEKNNIDTGICICEKQCETGNINTECYTCLYNLIECVGIEDVPQEKKEEIDTIGVLIIVTPIAVFLLYEVVEHLKKKRESSKEDIYDYDMDDYDEYIDDENEE